MTPAARKSLSKFLSLVLRHDPGVAHVVLDAAGWVGVDALIAGAAKAGRTVTRTEIEAVVETSEKARFTLSEDGARIRAAQGHSVEVSLGLEPVIPPESLFHGTAERTLPAILAEGLSPRARQHVHLSPDRATARQVGQRHGRPVVLRVAALAAHRGGQVVWQAENGVWLTGPLPARYLTPEGAP